LKRRKKGKKGRKEESKKGRKEERKKEVFSQAVSNVLENYVTVQLSFKLELKHRCSQRAA